MVYAVEIECPACGRLLRCYMQAASRRTVWCECGHWITAHTNIDGVVTTDKAESYIQEGPFDPGLQFDPPPFTVSVEIPELNEDGSCSELCPLWHPTQYCKKKLHLVIEEVVGFSVSRKVDRKPGPGCPRYKGEER